MNFDVISEYTGDYNQLLYLRARFYAPGIGIFVTKDTWEGDLKRPLSLNGWEYADGNPINYADPSGHKTVSVLLGSFVGEGVGKAPNEETQDLQTINDASDRKFTPTINVLDRISAVLLRPQSRLLQMFSLA
jgi:RHS repeat-associated protein